MCSFYSLEQPICGKLETGQVPVNPVTMSALALNADECHMVCKDTDQFPNAIGSQFFLQGGRETCECFSAYDSLEVPQDGLPDGYSLHLCKDKEGNSIT